MYKRREILIVGQDAATVNELFGGVRGEYTIYEVPNATAAQQVISRRAPDLVVIDAGDGNPGRLDLIATVREHHLVPVVVIGARGQEAVVMRALKLRATDYWQKPVSALEITRRLKALFAEGPPVEHRVEYAQGVIDRLAHTNVTVDAVAGEIGVSARRLRQVFRQWYGRSVSDYLREVRVRRAADLLAGTNWPIERVAQASGFSSAAYFVRVFKEVFRRTPGQYRLEVGLASQPGDRPRSLVSPQVGHA